MGNLLFVWTAISNMFDERMRTTFAQWFVSIVCSVFDQTRFNRLATHFNISMLGHQTMFNQNVWSPNIYRLDRPLVINTSIKKRDHSLLNLPKNNCQKFQCHVLAKRKERDIDHE